MEQWCDTAAIIARACRHSTLCSSCASAHAYTCLDCSHTLCMLSALAALQRPNPRPYFGQPCHAPLKRATSCACRTASNSYGAHLADPLRCPTACTSESHVSVQVGGYGVGPHAVATWMVIIQHGPCWCAHGMQPAYTIPCCASSRPQT